MRKKIWAAAGVFILLAVTGLVLFLNQGVKDFLPGKAGAQVSVEIASGETGSQIAAKLAKAGVVESSNYFYQYELAHPESAGIEPGTHLIQSHLDSASALKQMLDHKLVRGLINLISGQTLGDAITILKNDPALSGQLVLAQIAPAIANPGARLEGQLAPGAYYFAPGTKRSTALAMMANRFASEIAPALIKYKDLTPYQVLTVASLLIIEGSPQNYSQVARVIYNRLHIGMPLQLNSTVQYAANLRGQIALSSAATRINSSYNTYRNTGLPPSPIGLVSLAAIKAALSPASGNWLYFITVKPGDTRFTASFAEFERWKSLYLANLAAGAFK